MLKFINFYFRQIIWIFVYRNESKEIELKRQIEEMLVKSSPEDRARIHEMMENDDSSSSDDENDEDKV